MTSERETSSTTLVEDLVAGALGIVIVVALYSDGRAHALGLPDSFFTPWHAFLYGGLLLLVAWIALISRRAATRAAIRRRAVIPRGYGFAVLGAGLFAIGGALDMAWHIAFGIEAGIDALLSPSHLMLFVGGVLMMSGPVRAALRRPEVNTAASRVAPMLAVIGMSSVAAFSLIYLSGFLTSAPARVMGRGVEGSAEHFAAESMASAGLASYVITSLVLVVALVYLLRSRFHSAGSTTVVVTSLAVLAAAVRNFETAGVIVVAVLAGALTDVAILALRRRGASLRVQELVLAGMLPILLWSGQLLAIGLREGVRWSPEMASGAVILSALLSIATVLALGSPRQTRAEPTTPDARELVRDSRSDATV